MNLVVFLDDFIGNAYSLNINWQRVETMIRTFLISAFVMGSAFSPMFSHIGAISAMISSSLSRFSVHLSFMASLVVFMGGTVSIISISISMLFSVRAALSWGLSFSASPSTSLLEASKPYYIYI